MLGLNIFFTTLILGMHQQVTVIFYEDI